MMQHPPSDWCMVQHRTPTQQKGGWSIFSDSVGVCNPLCCGRVLKFGCQQKHQSTIQNRRHRRSWCSIFDPYLWYLAVKWCYWFQKHCQIKKKGSGLESFELIGNDQVCVCVCVQRGIPVYPINLTHTHLLGSHPCRWVASPAPAHSPPPHAALWSHGRSCGSPGKQEKLGSLTNKKRDFGPLYKIVFFISYTSKKFKRQQNWCSLPKCLN